MTDFTLKNLQFIVKFSEVWPDSTTVEHCTAVETTPVGLACVRNAMAVMHSLLSNASMLSSQHTIPCFTTTWRTSAPDWMRNDQAVCLQRIAASACSILGLVPGDVICLAKAVQTLIRQETTGEISRLGLACKHEAF